MSDKIINLIKIKTKTTTIRLAWESSYILKISTFSSALKSSLEIYNKTADIRLYIKKGKN